MVARSSEQDGVTKNEYRDKFYNSNIMLTFFNILGMYGVERNKIRLLRHGNKEIPIYDTFLSDIKRLEVYQSFQLPNKFGDAEIIAVFAPYHKTTALFLGLWNIVGRTKNKDFTDDIKLLLRKHNLPEKWFEISDQYHLHKNDVLDDLSERLVIEWGGATVSWVQKKDKEVIEIKGRQSVGDFVSFSSVDLDYQTLKKIIENPDTNVSWVKALSTVNGIYLIRDTVSGKLYVGSAYGDKGIFGRWSAYAQNGHGGNKELLDLDPFTFRFSILEIVPATTTIDDVIFCENQWKNKLGTRQFGLNKN